jgi:hypothetical protein
VKERKVRATGTNYTLRTGDADLPFKSEPAQSTAQTTKGHSQRSGLYFNSPNNL